MKVKMAKFKHNKKKNTAFLYETVVLELTKAILRKDIGAKNKISSLLRESFKSNTVLYADLKLYHSLTKTQNTHPRTAERILAEVKRVREDIDKRKLLNEQNKLVRRIRKDISEEALTNFVPSYKSLATIYQIFNQRGSIKTKVLLENQILSQMIVLTDKSRSDKMVPIDNLIYKTFTKKFNKEYSKELLGEQKILLSKFVSSFIDNGLQLKLYLNEEIKHLKESLNKSLLIEEFTGDEQMMEKAKKVLEVLEGYKKAEPQKEMVQSVMKIQGLVHEIKQNAVN